MKGYMFNVLFGGYYVIIIHYMTLYINYLWKEMLSLLLNYGNIGRSEVS